MNEQNQQPAIACESAELVEFLPLGAPGNGAVRFACLRLVVGASAWANSRPGQFVMLRPVQQSGLPVPSAWGHDLVWARAFSISQITDLGDGRFLVSLFLQAAGRGTSRLLGLEPGDRLLIWGPLGNGFALEPDVPTLLLAGGVGLAPFIGYAATHPRLENLRLEFGHRAALNCFPWSELPAGLTASAHFEQSSADLSAFLERISGLIAAHAAQNGLVLACGPKPFLAYVRARALALGARAQLSLETQMACGCGACLGCTTPAGPGLRAVPEAGWPVQVCLRGPVFWADEVEI